MRFTVGLLCCLCSGMLAGGAWGQPALVVNGGFEQWEPVALDAQGLVDGWALGEGGLSPSGWIRNSAYPGALLRGEEGDGGAYATLRKTSGGVHLYQMVGGLEAGKWYRFSARIRGGSLSVMAYQYFQSGPMNVAGIAQARAPGGTWRPVVGYYQVPGENWDRSALAIALEGDAEVQVDDLKLEPAEVPVPDPNAPEIVIENEAARLVLGPDARLRQLVCKADGVDYAAATPMPVVAAEYEGMVFHACTATLKGDRLEFGFPGDELRVALRVVPGARHWRFTVSDFEPVGLEAVTVSFPLRRLATQGWAFNANYDGQFGACLLGTTPTALARPGQTVADTVMPAVTCTSRRGIQGAGMALVAAPGDEFKAGIMEAERAAGLPCPMSGGQWLRDSETNRKSYLFAAPISAGDVDTIIEYAQIGGFQTVIFLKDSWLANHGHFDINTDSFPGGLGALKAAAAKVHAAGLECGVHVFGPTLSPNDPYVTPVPDRRLATVPCPPLAEGMDEASTTVALSGTPPLPPEGPSSVAFPGRYLRIGDEIIGYDQAEAGTPYRYVNVQRGALGTRVAAHPAGSEVNGLLTMWGFFLVDPDSSLGDELAANFARVFNACEFDFAYFDASDGSFPPYMDTDYYLGKLHLAIYRAIGRDVLYQTSMGTGSGHLWHIVPRSASADGHGDIKGYLDDRWPGILGMGNNLTKADVGWYYWFSEVRPDQIEYVCAKVLGIDGSLSLETSRAALETLPQSRQMMEMIGRWERCRRSRFFGEEVRALLREPKRDFKVFADGEGWKLYRAAYEEPRSVDALDGQQNVWTIGNDQATACLLGLEVVRSAREVALASYESEEALALDCFDRAEAYYHGADNTYEQFIVGDEKVVSETGVVRQGVTQQYEVSTTESRGGGSALVYSAQNTSDQRGWCGIGRRFGPTLDVSQYRGLGLWMSGDGNGEVVRIQLRDTQGRSADWTPVVNFRGWRLQTLAFPGDIAFDWSRVEFLLVYFNNIPDRSSVRVVLDGLRFIPALNRPRLPGSPVLRVNGEAVDLGAALEVGQSLTHEGLGPAMLWPRGMEAGRELPGEGLPLRLQPGENRVELSWNPPEAFPGGVDVMLYRLWPLEGTQ